jgi:hypothetical protein
VTFNLEPFSALNQAVRKLQFQLPITLPISIWRSRNGLGVRGNRTDIV